MSIFSKLNEQMDVPAERHKLRWWHFPLLIILVIGTIYVILENHHTSASYMKCSGQVFGTEYHITYNGSENLQDSIDEVLRQVDASLSPFNDQSIITAVNNNEDMTVNEMFSDVFLTAKAVSAVTDGAFDITVAPLVNAWGFGFKNKEDITDEKIQSILAHIGMNKVNLQGDKVVKTDTCVMLDCSAIAKGYGVDAVGQFLEGKGIKDYMVEIGGEVRLRGQNPKSEEWNIGINKPDDDSLGVNRELQDILHITNIAMATSGNYRNFYEEGNKKYAHTINPHTGYPAQQDILSSTVLAQNCAIADAFATAFMVMGSEEAKRILARHPEIMAYFICSGEDGEYEIWYSDRLKKYLK